MKKDMYLKETKILDYTHPIVEQLVRTRQWKDMPEYQRIGSVSKEKSIPV